MRTFLEPTDLDALNALLADLQSQLNIKSQQLADATNTLSTSCDTRIAALNTTISSQAATITANQTTITSLQNTINQNATTITSLQNTINQNSTTISQQQAIINQQKDLIWRLGIVAPRVGSYTPLYSWNCAGYDQVIADKQRNPTVPIVVAINPASGPGTAYSSTIATAVTAMKNAGVIVLGYVGSNYGSELTKAQYPVGNPWPSNTPNTLADVEGRCLNYVQWYGVDGFMFDDYSNKQFITMPDGTAKDVYTTFYQPLITYARSLTGIKYIKGNMGTKPLYLPLVDLLDNVCVYEGTSNPSLATLQANTLNGQLRNKATIVVYNTTTLDQQAMTQCGQYAKFYYCSDSGYSKPPIFYDQLITTLSGL